MNETVLATSEPAVQSASPVAQHPPAWKRLTRIGGHSLASIVDQGASAAINFVSSVFIGRLIGAEALGIFAMTSVLVMALRLLQGGAVLEPMSVFGPRRTDEERGGYLGFVVILEVLWIGGVSALIVLGAVVWWGGAQIGQMEMRTIVASLVFANLVTFQYLMRRQFYVDHQPYSALIQSLAYLVLSAAGLWLYMQTGSVTIVGMYLVLSFCSLIVCGVQGLRLWREVRFPSDQERHTFSKEHWNFGRWVLLSVPVSIAYYQGYFLLCGALLSAEETGYLKAVDSFVAPFTQVAIGLSMMFVPMLSRRYDQMSVGQRNAFTRKLLAGMMSISWVYAAMAFFFGPTLLLMAYGENLAAAGPIIRTMAIVPLCIGLIQPAGVTLTAHRRSDLRFMSDALAAVVTFAVGIPLMLNFGLQGATWGMCLSQAARAAGLWGAVFWLRSRSSGTVAKSDGPAADGA